jgi:hypothetical protein
MKVKDFLDTSEKWTKGRWARDAGGRMIPYTSVHAVSRCLAGLICWCYKDSNGWSEIWDKINREIGGACIAFWNDASERTFEDVKALVEKLDI